MIDLWACKLPAIDGSYATYRRIIVKHWKVAYITIGWKYSKPNFIPV
jgi:hypothetical protein